MILNVSENFYFRRHGNWVKMERKEKNSACSIKIYSK